MTWKLAIKLLAFFILFQAGGMALSGERSMSDYRLGVGDQIKVIVYGEPELSLDFVLSDAGTISYPFLGEIKVKGMTVSGLETLLAEQLKKGFLVAPKVNVRMLGYRQFFINGEVRTPGGYPFLPGLTVQKAIALAGGFTERAARSSISVIHDDDASQTPQEVELGSPIRPGDILLVDESFF
ncbi:MAG: polysaccharide export protein [Proteobacteria bacterium]|nr:polysaccharide export protein [Pseudomonadota bacterium]